jgi:hypothetical protein
MSTRDIIASADVSAKRYSLFKWDVTDKDWWLKVHTISFNDFIWLDVDE